MAQAFFTTNPIEIGTTGKGTELGLSLCDDIVKKHNGTISAKSKESAGSSFLIQLAVN